MSVTKKNPARPAVKKTGPATTKKGLQINKKWFIDQLADRGMSMRRLATLIEVDVSGVSLMFSGKRQMRAEEAGAIAKALGVPVDEVLRQAGVDLRAVSSSGAVAVSAWVSEDGEVHLGETKGPKVVQSPAGVSEGVQAARMIGGSRDGWVLFFRQPRVVGVESIGRLCVVEIRGMESPRVAWVRPGWGEGDFNLQGLGGEIFQGILEKAAPILWMKQ